MLVACKGKKKKSYYKVISGKNIKDVIEFTYGILDIITKIEKLNVLVFDFEKERRNSNWENIFDNFKSNLSDAFESFYDFNLLVIIGIDKLIANVNKDEFNDVFYDLEQSGKFNCILAGDIDSFNFISMEPWFKLNYSGDNGIWVGNGGTDQRIIGSDNLKPYGPENKIGNTYGIVTKNRNSKIIKLYGMRDRSSEDE